MLGASTTSWSNRFHLLITRFEKKCLATSPVHWAFINFRLWPRVPFLLSSIVNNFWALTRLIPLMILNTSIESCLFLFSSPPVCWWNQQNSIERVIRLAQSTGKYNVSCRKLQGMMDVLSFSYSRIDKIEMSTITDLIPKCGFRIVSIIITAAWDEKMQRRWWRWWVTS